MPLLVCLSLKYLDIHLASAPGSRLTKRTLQGPESPWIDKVGETVGPAKPRIDNPLRGSADLGRAVGRGVDTGAPRPRRPWILVVFLGNVITILAGFELWLPHCFSARIHCNLPIPLTIALGSDFNGAGLLIPLPLAVIPLGASGGLPRGAVPVRFSGAPFWNGRF